VTGQGDDRPKVHCGPDIVILEVPAVDGRTLTLAAMRGRGLVFDVISRNRSWGCQTTIADLGRNQDDEHPGVVCCSGLDAATINHLLDLLANAITWAWADDPETAAAAWAASDPGVRFPTVITDWPGGS
jgi:hypothetical protein